MIEVIEFDVSRAGTIHEAWHAFAAKLRATGAGDQQVDSMEMAFYMGAGYVFAKFDTAARSKNAIHSIADAMTNVHREIDERMQRNMLDNMDPEGTA